MKDKMIGQLVQLPIDKCIGVVIEDKDNSPWANVVKVMPIEDTFFYDKGKVEVILRDQVTPVKHRIQKAKKR